MAVNVITALYLLESAFKPGRSVEAEANPRILGSTLETGVGLAPLANSLSIGDMGAPLAPSLGLQMSLSLPLLLQESSPLKSEASV